MPNLQPRPSQGRRHGLAAAGPWPRERNESMLLRRPWVYTSWCVLGQRAWMERALLRVQGPFSKPLAPQSGFEPEYDLRDCRVMDTISGPGWGWPEPEHTCFWSDRGDARLLVPLQRNEDHVIVLSLSARQQESASPTFLVYANGHELCRFGPEDGLLVVVLLKRSQHAGTWVELSFRPRPYPGIRQRWASLRLKRSLAASRLLVVDMPRLATYFRQPLQAEVVRQILLGNEPVTGKFARIREKAAVSPYRTAAELPGSFDPLAYVLLYPDLLEHEVDPYWHYLNHGREEGRRW